MTRTALELSEQTPAAATTPRKLEPSPVRQQGLVSIVLATLNERETITDTLRGVFEHVTGPVEVIVVDDDSPDETWKVVEGLQDPRVKVIRRVATRGLASAFMRGIMEARGDVIGWMDADMGMPPELLPAMIERLRDHDIVIGSRYCPGGEDVRHPLRVTASKAICGLARLVLGHGIRDYDSGFVVVRRDVFNKVLPIPVGYGEYFIEFIYACCEKGLRVTEVPYRFADRTKGVSKSFPSLSRFLAHGLKYALRIFRARLRRID